MGTCGDFLLEGAVPGFLHDDLVRLGVSAARRRHCGDQIIHVRGETGMGELAFAGTQPGEIEAQHSNAMRCEVMRDQTHRFVALAAGKAMREQSHRADRPSGRSSSTARLWPLLLGKSKRSAGIAISLFLV